MSVHHCITVLRRRCRADLPLLPNGLVLLETEGKDLEEEEGLSPTDMCW